MNAQHFATCNFMQACRVQVFAICILLRVCWECRPRFSVVYVVSTPFLRKFLMRTYKKVTQKTMRNDINDTSKKLQIQRRAARAKNCGGE